MKFIFSGGGPHVAARAAVDFVEIYGAAEAAPFQNGC
jgi:hypothetical protein